MNNEVAVQEGQKISESLGFSQSKPQGHMVSVDAEKSIAEIKAMVSIAKMFPRDEANCSERIKNACQRQSLAEVARYTYSRGGTEVTGPSIRLVEAVAQIWGNLKWGWQEMERLQGKSLCRAFCWDMEHNSYREMDFTVPHYRDTRSGRKPLKDDRDIYEHCANMASRRMRSCIENMIPGDVLEVAQKECDSTLRCNIEVTEDTIKKLLETFEKEYGVTRSQIEKRIGRSAESIAASQMVSLRRVYAGLKDGMGKVEDYFEKIETEEKPETPKKGTEAVKDKLSKKTQEPKEEPKEEAKKDWGKFVDDVNKEVDSCKTMEELGELQVKHQKDLDLLSKEDSKAHQKVIDKFTNTYQSIQEKE